MARKSLKIEALESKRLMTADTLVEAPQADDGLAEIEFVEVAGETNEPICYLKYKLDRCWIKSWSTSGDADDRPTEEVSVEAIDTVFNPRG